MILFNSLLKTRNPANSGGVIDTASIDTSPNNARISDLVSKQKKGVNESTPKHFRAHKKIDPF